MIDLFERQVVKCRSINQFNRLHIALENRLTPLEVRDLSRLIAGRYSTTPNADWIGNLQDRLDLNKKPDPEPYLRRRLKPNLYLYSSGGDPVEKTLMIGFTGGWRRLMMPVPVILQNLDSSATDLLLISRHGKSKYSDGISGLASSFDELMTVLENVVASCGYRRVVSYGVSAGGIPALLTALYLDLERGIGVGSQSIMSEQWRWVLNDEKLKLKLQNWNGKPELLNVFGSDYKKDRDAAIETQKVLPSALWSVPDENRHGATFRYWQSGTMWSFLQKVLMADWKEYPGGSHDFASTSRERIRNIQGAIDQLRLQDEAVFRAAASSIKRARLYRSVATWIYETGRTYLPEEAVSRFVFFVRKIKRKLSKLFRT